MNNLRQIDLKDKKVLLRVDFNVPVSEKGQIEESFRIKKQKEVLDWLLEHGAQVVMVSHITSVLSFTNLIPQLHILLGLEINFIKSVPEIGSYLEHYAGPALLENIRQNSGEEKNDPEFAKQLATGFDLYVNNAFGECHRDYASVSGITKSLPSYAGFLVEEEIARLSEVINFPREGKVIVMGGAKAETKVPVIKNFIDKADRILIGGVVANDILKEKGMDIGSSVADDNSKELLAGLDLNNPVLALPKDFVISESKILDIGQETEKEYADIINNADMVIWNGPMGMFEKQEFAHGTKAIVEAMIDSNAVKIIGGGDTISAIDKFGLGGRFDPSASSGQVFISTGGGAMLSFLAGERLPGLEALNYYN